MSDSLIEKQLHEQAIRDGLVGYDPKRGRDMLCRPSEVEDEITEETRRREEEIVMIAGLRESSGGGSSYEIGAPVFNAPTATSKLPKDCPE